MPVDVVLVTGGKKPQKKVPGEELMRKFSESQKERCKYVSNLKSLPSIESAKPKELPTGSTYSGNRDHLGMHGFGIYTYPDGCVYSGEFIDGQFHGEGELTTTNGERLRGTWNHGILTDGILYFCEGLEFKKRNWTYIRGSDRRFHLEYEKGLPPAPHSYKTAMQPTITIPPNLYDTCDGFYDPKFKNIFSYECNTKLLRTPVGPLQKWIVDNCRSSHDAPVGPIPEHYESFYCPTKYLTGDEKPQSLRKLSELHYGDPGFDEKWRLIQKTLQSSSSAIEPFEDLSENKAMDELLHTFSQWKLRTATQPEDNSLENEASKPQSSKETVESSDSLKATHSN